jgi:hypothetical protein
LTVNHTIKSPSAAAVPSLFCPPQLIAGEDPVAYDEFFATVCASVKPADIIEEIWARDFVDCDWDVRRYRRLKVALMAATAYEGLQKVLEPISFEGWLELVEDWAARKPEAIEEVDRRLAAAGLTIDAVMAQTLCEHLDEFKCIYCVPTGRHPKHCTLPDARAAKTHTGSSPRPSFEYYPFAVATLTW